jgi:hypothetical protein
MSGRNVAGVWAGLNLSPAIWEAIAGTRWPADGTYLGWGA